MTKPTINRHQIAAEKDLIHLQEALSLFLIEFNKRAKTSSSNILKFSDNLLMNAEQIKDLSLKAQKSTRAFMENMKLKHSAAFTTHAMHQFQLQAERLTEDLDKLADRLPKSLSKILSKSFKFGIELKQVNEQIKEQQLSEQNKLSWSPF